MPKAVTFTLYWNSRGLYKHRSFISGRMIAWPNLSSDGENHLTQNGQATLTVRQIFVGAFSCPKI